MRITDLKQECVTLIRDGLQLGFVCVCFSDCLVELCRFAGAGIGVSERGSQLFTFCIGTVEGTFNNGTPLGDALFGLLLLGSQAVILGAHAVECVVPFFDRDVRCVPCFDVCTECELCLCGGHFGSDVCIPLRVQSKLIVELLERLACCLS